MPEVRVGDSLRSKVFAVSTPSPGRGTIFVFVCVWLAVELCLIAGAKVGGIPVLCILGEIICIYGFSRVHNRIVILIIGAEFPKFLPISVLDDSRGRGIGSGNRPRPISVLRETMGGAVQLGVRECS